MPTKRQTGLLGVILIGACLALALAGVALAQPPPELEALNIALWPEYDRPAVLVIYRGQVADGAPLPASLSFRLPGEVTDLNAVAFLDEAQGRLLNLPEYELAETTDGKLLSFATPSRQFQFEYYSDSALRRDGDTRELSFVFTPVAEVASLSFELQQPTAAGDFTSEPPPTTTQVRPDGLTYALYDLGAVSAGQAQSLQASYTRESDGLSVDSWAPSPIEQTPVVVGEAEFQDYLGPILIAVGILLLTGALLYWFWSQRSVVSPQPAPRRSSTHRRRPARTTRPASSKSDASPAGDVTLASYCHQCGAKFREDAAFCHACGTQRRAE